MLFTQNEIIMNRAGLRSLHSNIFCREEKKNRKDFFLSVASGSIRTTVSVHTEKIHQQISFYEARQFA